MLLNNIKQLATNAYEFNLLLEAFLGFGSLHTFFNSNSQNQITSTDETSLFLKKWTSQNAIPYVQILLTMSSAEDREVSFSGQR